MAGYRSVESVNDEPSVEAERLSDALRASGEGDDGRSSGESSGRGGDEPFRWRKRHTLLAILAVFLIAVVISIFIQLPYYAITPGSAPDVSRFIAVPKADRHTHRGSVSLVYVEITSLRAIEYPFFWLDPNAEIDPSGSILGVETPAQYATEGEIDMATAQQAATVVALRELGYKVPVVPVGALVYGILPGSPAAAALHVGDVISRLDGKRVPTYANLEKKLEQLVPFTTLHLVVSVYPAGKARTVSLRLGVFRVQNAYTLVCSPEGTGTRYRIWKVPTVAGGNPHSIACLGVYPQGSGNAAIDGTAFKVGPLPVKVNLSSEGIVGPSAGLAFTLGLMQELDAADLTGGLKIAATGTMSIDGTVGDVGGVAQKTVAVRGAGARVFFVPPPEYQVAKAHAGPHLRIYAVSSIGQAIHILESLGGRIARTTAG